MSPPRLLTSLLPSNVLRCELVDLCDVRDLMGLCDADPAVLAELQTMSAERGWRFRARRILSEEELQWLAARRLAVALLEETIHLRNRTEWRRNGVLHRDDDLPAMVCANGIRKWYREGKLHRGNDLPAVDTVGSCEWYWEGKLHRGNERPAVMKNSGACAWFTHGVIGAARDGRIDYNAQPKFRTYDGTQVFGPRTDGGPNLVFSDGTRVWGEYSHLLRCVRDWCYWPFLHETGTFILKCHMTPRILYSEIHRRWTAFASDGKPILNPAKHKRAVQTFLRQQADAAAQRAAEAS